MKKGTFYRKSLLIVMMITCLPMLLIGILIYTIGVGKIEHEMNLTHEYRLDQASQRLEDYLSHFEMTALQWAFNPIFGQQLLEMDFRDQFTETKDLYKTLAVLKGTDPLIDQAYIYLQDRKLLISDNHGVVPLPEEVYASYGQLLVPQQSLFWGRDLPEIKPSGHATGVPLIVKLPSIGEPYGAILIYVSKSKLENLIGDLSGNPWGVSFLYEKNGAFIASGKNESSIDNDMKQALIGFVNKNTEQADSDVISYLDETYAVSFSPLSRLGSTWTFVTATPLSQIKAPVVWMSRFVIAVSLVMLLLSAVLSWFASRKLYSPVHRLVGLLHTSKEPSLLKEDKDEFAFIENRWRHISRESRLLEQRLNQQLPTLKESFLLQLVQGHLYSFSEEEIRERMTSLGWEPQDGGYTIAVLQLHGLSKLEGRFLEGDEQLVTFAAANIIQELASVGSVNVEVINFQDLSVGLLVFNPPDREARQMKNELIRLANELTAALNSLLHLRVTLVIGKAALAMKHIPQDLEEARQALRYRDLLEDNQIVDMEELLPKGPQTVYYPFELEKTVIQAIRLGAEQEAAAQIELFATELQLHNGKEIWITQGMLQLLGNIQNALLQAGFNTHSMFDGANLFEQLNLLREPEEMVRWFRDKVIAPYIKELNETYNVQRKLLVENVLETISRDYMKDISLESCAEELGTYPLKISQSFRQLTGINFIDYLTAFRLDVAKRLLVESDCKIVQIAEQVGYQPSYFNRIFKKHEQLTPGEYREKARSADRT